MWRGQEKGAARIGYTGKPFDEPTTQKTPALRVAFAAGARGVAALDRISDTLFASVRCRYRPWRIASQQRNAVAPIWSNLL